MDFQRLLEVDCGQRNPLSQLIQHVTEDQTFQDSIGNPTVPGQYQNNSLPPQSFRMDDLMREMKHIEPGATALQGNYEQTWHDVTTQNYENNTNNFYSQDFVCGFPPPPNAFQEAQQFFEHINHQNELKIVPNHFEFKSEAPAKNLIAFEGGVTVQSLDELEDVNQPEEDFSDSREIDDEPNSKTEIRPEFNNPKEFLEYIYDYAEERNEHEWNLRYPNNKFERVTQEDVLDPMDYSHIKNNPVENESNVSEKGREALCKDDFTKSILYFDEAVRRDKTSVIKWYQLGYALSLKREHDKAISVLKQSLRLDPSYIHCNKVMFDIYSWFGCKYQACQSIFNWLKHNKKYNHLIPPDFTMEDKDTTKLDKNQLDAVKNIFLKAVRQDTSTVDSALQVMISSLYKLSNDNDKVADCQLAALNSSKVFDYELLNLGVLYFREDKPYEALDVFFEAVETVSQKARANLWIALIYMYLKNYREAIQYFRKIVDPDQPGGKSKFEPEENTLEAQYQLCLHLFFEYYSK